MAKREEVLEGANDSQSMENSIENHRSFICSLKNMGDFSVAEVGAKAANLAVLLHAGLPVPAGVVVTTRVFAQYLSDISLDATAETVRNQVLSCDFDPQFQSDLRKAICVFAGQPVAVRSSGVAEDLEGASFAGQYDTFLDVVGYDDIEHAIRECWASAFSDHILQYRKTNQIASERMAVLIQPMVQADAAGVAFTANPVTGNRDEIVVSAVRGVGERLVSGHATPDEWAVYDGQAVARSLPEKAVSSEQVLQVAQLARQVEMHLGEPQDIEWAISGNRLYLLQARPITTLDAEVPSKTKTSTQQSESPIQPMVEVPIAPPEGFWEREESHFPDPLTPMMSSFFIPGMNHAFRQTCSEMSMLIETLELKEIGGWVYQRTVPLGGRERKAPPAFLMPLMIRIVPPLKARIQGSVKAIREDKAGKYINQWYSEWKAEIIHRRDELLGVNLTTLSDSDLARHLEQTHLFLHESVERHMLLNGAIQLIIAEYAFACQDLLGWDEREIMQVFSGLSETSSAPARDLAKLVKLTRSNPNLLQDVQDGLPIKVLMERHPDFLESFSTYFDNYGCRAIRYELNFPTVGESPELFFQLLKDQLARNYDPDEDARVLEQQRIGQVQGAEAILQTKSGADRDRFHNALARAQKAYPVREEHGFYDRDAPLALLRYAVLEAGCRLVRRDGLKRVDDAFFLKLDELVSSLKGRVGASGTGVTTFELVERRQAERNWVLAHPGPASYGSVASAPPSFDALPPEARFAVKAVFWTLEQTFATALSGQEQKNAYRMQGIAASKGTYTGRVRVIRDESEFPKIQPGDVMVCQITSPVWSMLFPTIGALVTDSGGLLSHSAIIAREYRIPAVVATGNATALLRDGQMVTVDGDNGTVESP